MVEIDYAKDETELVLGGLKERATEAYNKEPRYATVELRAEEVLALLKTISPAGRDEVRQLKYNLSDAVTAVQQERDEQVSKLSYALKVAREEVEALKAQRQQHVATVKSALKKAPHEALAEIAGLYSDFVEPKCESCGGTGELSFGFGERTPCPYCKKARS